MILLINVLENEKFFKNKILLFRGARLSLVTGLGMWPNEQSNLVFSISVYNSSMFIAYSDSRDHMGTKILASNN